MTLKRTLFSCLLIVLGLNLVSAQETIIATGDEWHYHDEADAPPEGWNNNMILTDNWKKGVSPLGYGSDIVTTRIGYGDDKENKHIVKYFKKTFRLDDPFEHLIYKLNVQRDDGIVVYLNGQEIMRDNIPNGVVGNETRASSLIFTDSLERKVHTKLLAPDEFKIGTNILGISVHQARPVSSDCIFNLELIGDDNPAMISILLKERSIKSLNLEMRLKEINYKQQLEKRDQNSEFLKQKNSNLFNGLLAISFLLLLLLLGLAYLLWSHKKTKTELVKTVDNLNSTIKDKDQKLLSSSLNSAFSQQFLKELKDNLSASSNEEEKTLKKEIQRTIQKIDYNIDHDEEWINLLSHFNSLNNSFVENLNSLYPSLSENEQRHCIFIKLHMQTKEIAKLMHIDPRSVQAARYRIKKKMNLDDKVNLMNYIQEQL